MASKYRFVTATEDKLDKQIQNVAPTGAVWDCSSLMACSSEFIAVPWQTPGAVGIFKTGVPFKTMPTHPFLFGHTGAVIDVAFSPFDPRLLATAGDDSTVRIWNIPEAGITAKTDSCSATLAEHTKKVGMLQYHPSARNILATASTDNTVKIWDLTVGKSAYTASPTEDQLLSISFNLDGSAMCATSKDKKITVFDTRTGAVAASAVAHQGIKNQRVIWAKRRNQLISCGFGPNASCREVKIWDPRNISTALYTMEVDKQSAVLMPFLDEDTGILYLGGKGEGAIRYYELRDDATPIAPASSYNSSELAKGLCMAPKAILDVSSNELARFYKLTSKNIIGVHLALPRRGTEFQDAFYPPTFAGVPALEAADFLAGKNAEPLLQDMKAVFDKKSEVVLVSSPTSSKPASPSTPAPTEAKPTSPVEAKPATPAPVETKPATPSVEAKPATPVEAKPATPVETKPETPTPESKPKTPEPKPATPTPEAKPATPTEPKAATPEPEAKQATPMPESSKWDGNSTPTQEQRDAQAKVVADLETELRNQQNILREMESRLGATTDTQEKPTEQTQSATWD